MSKVSMVARARRSRLAKERTRRTRTRFLLTRLRDQVNSGEVDPELQKKLDVHFGTLWKFRMKS
jgi:hypothetical protein